jgi:thiol-disulfide isomerase/thioredoxin
MKKLLAGIFILSTLVLVGCEQHPQPEAKTVSENIIFTTLQNKQITLESLKGKWVVLNYWASWCKPCYKEIPALNAFAKKYRDKVVVMGISYDQLEPDQLPALVKKMKIEFTTLKYDPSAEVGIGHVPGLPATYLLNPEGKLVKTLLGEQTEESLARQIA